MLRRLCQWGVLARNHTTTGAALGGEEVLLGCRQGQLHGAANGGCTLCGGAPSAQHASKGRGTSRKEAVYASGRSGRGGDSGGVPGAVGWDAAIQGISGLVMLHYAGDVAHQGTTE